MYSIISRWAITRPKRVILFFVVLLVVMAAAAGGVFQRLKGGGFDDPKSESSRSLRVLEREFHTGPTNLVLVVTPTDGRALDDPSVAAAGTQLTERLSRVEGIDTDDTVSYWSTQSPALASTDHHRGLILSRAVGDEDAVSNTIDRVHAAIKDVPAGVNVQVAGEGEFFHQLSTTIQDDLSAAESLALPITLVLLVIIFAGLRAASLPLAVGIVAIFGAFGVLFALTQLTNVSVFSISLISALGLGLAIDYSLLIVSRFREELGVGHSVDEAVRITVQNAGRAITFSGLTVAVSLAALLIFPLYFLRSFAYAGIGVILVAMLASIVMLPALLKLFGNRLAPKTKMKALARHRDDTFWARQAHRVMKRPVAVIAVVGSMLLLLGVPFLGIHFGQPDDRVMPPGSEIRQVSDVLRNEFSSTETDSFPVVATEPVTPAEVTAYAKAVSALPSVTRVDAVDGGYVGGQKVAPPDPSSARLGNGESVWFNVVPKVEPISVEAEKMISEIRHVDVGFHTAVAGQSAALVDSKEAIFSRIPVAGLIVAFTTFALLFLMFGSVLVPIKAIVLNVLSLTATFGLMVWVFQQGHLSGLLNFTSTGLTDTSEPILMFCIAFGLSMDYEVFLLSRIKEEYDRTGDNEASVAKGLARTGRIVTAAAVLLSVTFFAFATSGVTFIKLFGVGLGVAVLVDAFIIRATLVPALMKVAGKANWWAPRPLAAIHRRFGIKEGGAERPAPASPYGPPSIAGNGQQHAAGAAPVPEPALDLAHHNGDFVSTSSGPIRTK